FTHHAPPAIYTLSLHDALPILIAALLGGLAYLNGVGQQPTYAVLMPARDLPRGAVLSTDDFVPQRVALPDTMAAATMPTSAQARSEEHTSELQSRENLVCRLLL